MNASGIRGHVITDIGVVLFWIFIALFILSTLISVLRGRSRPEDVV